MPASIIASVVFLKVQEFGRRPASEQARMRAQLEAVIAVVTADLKPSSRIVLEASDGVALVLLDDPVGALRLAQQALTSAAAGLPLSAGLNHGALQLSGRKGAEAMTGDGIAVAAAVADFATSPKLLASRAFRDALADARPGQEVALARAGTFTDPGLRAHELFAPDAKAPARRSLRYTLASLAMIVALVGGGIGARASADGDKPIVGAWLSKVQPYFRELARRVSR